VFTAFSHRVTDLFRIIEEVAFQRIDVCLRNDCYSLLTPGVSSARRTSNLQTNSAALAKW
jgi:hypothetical protein